MKSVVLGLVASFAANAACAQALSPVAPTQALDGAVAEGCVPVVSQRLALNAPSEALARASLRTHQPNAVERAAFSGFADGAGYASRPSSAGASVVLADDASSGRCRVALFGAPERDLSASLSYLEALVRTLTRVSGGPQDGVFTGSIDGSPRLRLTIDTPPPIAGPVGGPQIILTFAREGA